MTNFLKLASASAIALTLVACGAPETSETSRIDVNAAAEKTMAAKTKMDEMKSEAVMFGGAKMYPSKTIVQNASEANNLTTLVALVKQAELVDTLSSSGPFTVFAPTDRAFFAVPEATTSALMEDENRELLQGILTYHVVSGKITATKLIAAIKDNGGMYKAETVAGGDLTFRLAGDKVRITDGKGVVSTVTTADLMQSNGVVHVVDKVLMPK